MHFKLIIAFVDSDKTDNILEAAREGIAFQIDVEDAVGVMHQIEALENTVEEKI